MQINLTGFLNARNAREFVSELWTLLASAMENVSGIPTRFLDQKKEEIKKRQVSMDKFISVHVYALYLNKFKKYPPPFKIRNFLLELL